MRGKGGGGVGAAVGNIAMCGSRHFISRIDFAYCMEKGRKEPWTLHNDSVYCLEGVGS